MHDVALLKKIASRKAFTRLSGHIKQHAVSKETWKMIGGMSQYFRSYPDIEEVVWSDFQTLFFTINKFKGDEHAIYTTYFDKVKEEDVDSLLMEDVLKSYITKDYATQVLNKSMDVINDVEGAALDEVAAIMTSYAKEVGRSVSKEDLFVPTDLSYMLKSCGTKGLEWRLEELNMSAGPLRDGDFIIVAARPETGKTTFLASELTHFASQLTDDSRPIVWVNNEEVSHKVMSRVIQAYFGVTLPVLQERAEEYNEEYNKVIGKRIRVINDDMGMNDVKNLSTMFEETNPCMIVFDQLDKVYGFEKESSREDIRIGKLYEWGRTLAKKYGPCIAISQASEAADHVTYIEQGMLRGSKTDKAGEADCIITIGRDKENEYKRYIHLAKNKLWGGARSVEVHRHGKFEVEIRPEIARYVGLF